MEKRRKLKGCSKVTRVLISGMMLTVWHAAMWLCGFPAMRYEGRYAVYAVRGVGCDSVMGVLGDVMGYGWSFRGEGGFRLVCVVFFNG